MTNTSDEHLDHIRAALALMGLAVDHGPPLIGRHPGGQLLARGLLRIMPAVMQSAG
jgi:hypothetical protein